MRLNGGDNLFVSQMNYSCDCLLAVYCPAGFYIVNDAHNRSHCQGCPKNTYKSRDNYYDRSCMPCPKDRPRTFGVNSTYEDCRFGWCMLLLFLKIDLHISRNWSAWKTGPTYLWKGKQGMGFVLSPII